MSDYFTPVKFRREQIPTIIKHLKYIDKHKQLKNADILTLLVGGNLVTYKPYWCLNRDIRISEWVVAHDGEKLLEDPEKYIVDKPK